MRQKTRRLISFFTTVFMLLGCLSISGQTASAEDDSEKKSYEGEIEIPDEQELSLPDQVVVVPGIDDADDLEQAINQADNSGDILTILQISKDITLNHTLTIAGGQHIQLESAGDKACTIEYDTLNINHFEVTGGSFVLKKIILDGKNIGGGIYGSDAQLLLAEDSVIRNCTNTAVRVASSSILQMQDNSSIEDCKASTNTGGGGILVGGYSQAVLSGGAVIRNCDATVGSGGAIYLSGEGSFVKLKDDILIENCTAMHKDRGGGGIYVGPGGTLVMEGGTISGCTSKVGGGVMLKSEINDTAQGVPRAEFLMLGGSIENNQAKRISSSGNGNGGGVFVDCLRRGNASDDPALFVLDGGTIQNNTAYSYAGFAGGGGGIFASGDVIIESGSVELNQAIDNSFGGGGIFVNDVCHLTINGGTIENNTTTAYGGGILCSYGTTIINDGVIRGNESASPGGGIMVVANNGDMDIHLEMFGGLVEKNSAPRGAGIEFNTGHGTLSGVTIRENISTSASHGGGGISTALPVTIEDCTITNNAAAGVGGGIYFFSTSPKVDISGNTLISGNTATDGGGIYCSTEYGAVITSADTKFSGNKADTAALPPDTAAEDYPQIGFASFTLPDHPLNNYDINFAGSPIDNYQMAVEVHDQIRPEQKLKGAVFTLSYQQDGITYYYAVHSGDGTHSYWSTDEADAYQLVSDAGGLLSVPDVYDGVEYTFTQVGKYSGYQQIDDKHFVFDKTDPEIKKIPAMPVYTVTFHNEDTIHDTLEEVAHGSGINPPSAPELREGYTFDDNWYRDNGAFEQPWDFEDDTVTQDIDLYANWLRNTHDILYYVNGTLHSSKTAYSYGETVPLPEIQKEGYRFEGWYTDQDCTQPWPDGGTMPDRDLALYARLTAVEHKLTYHAANETGLTVQDATRYDASYTIRDIEEFGWSYGDRTFAGWSLTEGGTGADYQPRDPLTIKGDVNLYAVWKAAPEYPYTIEYYYDGERDGTLTEEGTVKAGTVISGYTDNRKDGYRLDREEKLPLTVSKDGENTIRIYYVKEQVPGPDPEYPYVIEYYYDGERDDALTEEGTAQAGTVISGYTDNSKEGYHLEREENLPLMVSKDGENTIRIYYVKEQVPGPDPEYPYAIEYYYDGERDDALTEEGTAQAGTVISGYTDNSKEGYHLEREENLPLTVSKDGENTIRIYYVKEQVPGPDPEYPYAIEYYYDGERDDALTEEGTAQAGTVISGYTDNSKEGYRLDREENLPLTVGEDRENIIRIYYVKEQVPGPDPEYPYTIEYYYDGQRDDTLTEECAAKAGTVISGYTYNGKEGYRLEREENLPLTVSKDGENIIRIYYVKEQVPSPDPEYPYTIEYYYDGERDDTLTETGTVQAGTVISGYTDNSKDSYQLEREENLPLVVSKDGENTIRIYYVKEQVPDPDPEYPYTIEYYYDGERDDTLTETGTAQAGTVISGYTDNSKDSYQLEREENLPLVVSKDGENTIRIYYVKEQVPDPDPEYPYTIEYYYDGERDDTLTETGTAQAGTVISGYTDNSKDSYQLEREENLPLVVSKDGENTIRIYYVKEQAPDPDPEYLYTIEYYYDGERDDTLTEGGTAKAGTVISGYTDHRKGGYRLEREENLPLIVSNNPDKNVIRIYYVSESEKEKPVPSEGISTYADPAPEQPLAPYTADHPPLLPATLFMLFAGSILILLIRKRNSQIK